MRRLIPTLLVAVFLLTACSTYYVKPPDVNVPCPVCGYSNYAYRLVSPHWPLFVNGVLVQYDEATVVVKCRVCGYAYPVDRDGNPRRYYGDVCPQSAVERSDVHMHFDKRGP
jgi:ribosomal protein S27E